MTVSDSIWHMAPLCGAGILVLASIVYSIQRFHEGQNSVREKNKLASEPPLTSNDDKKQKNKNSKNKNKNKNKKSELKLKSMHQKGTSKSKLLVEALETLYTEGSPEIRASSTELLKKVFTLSPETVGILHDNLSNQNMDSRIKAVTILRGLMQDVNGARGIYNIYTDRNTIRNIIQGLFLTINNDRNKPLALVHFRESVRLIVDIIRRNEALIFFFVDLGLIDVLIHYDKVTQLDWGVLNDSPAKSVEVNEENVPTENRSSISEKSGSNIKKFASKDDISSLETFRLPLLEQCFTAIDLVPSNDITNLMRRVIAAHEFLKQTQNSDLIDYNDPELSPIWTAIKSEEGIIIEYVP